MNIWVFLVATTAISTVGWVINTWIRARHGYPLEDKLHDSPRKTQLNALSVENQELKAQVLQLEDRLAVLERIATDPAERTAREIEQLRHN